MHSMYVRLKWFCNAFQQLCLPSFASPSSCTVLLLWCCRSENFSVAFFRIRNVCVFNFHHMAKWWKIINGKNFLIYGTSCLTWPHVLQYKYVGMLLREKHTLEQLHLKEEGASLFSRVGLFSRDCCIGLTSYWPSNDIIFLVCMHSNDKFIIYIFLATT